MNLEDNEKFVTGFEGEYSVNTDGDVFSHLNGKKKLKQLFTRRYWSVCFWNRREKKYKRFSTQSLVLLMFIGPRPEGLQIDHKDGNTGNNHLSNLEYVTGSENCKRSFKTGLQCNKGEKHSRSKLTNEDVIKIRYYAANGYKDQEIASMYNVCREAISKVRRGQRWSHIQ